MTWGRTSDNYATNVPTPRNMIKHSLVKIFRINFNTNLARQYIPADSQACLCRCGGLDGDTPKFLLPTVHNLRSVTTSTTSPHACQNSCRQSTSNSWPYISMQFSSLARGKEHSTPDDSGRKGGRASKREEKEKNLSQELVSPALPRGDALELVKNLLQPMPLGRHNNTSLFDHSVIVNNTMFLDPSKTLESTMRALYVIKEVLRNDGHIYILNSNPLLQPLLREAALCCINPNVWFMTEPWVSGALSPPATGRQAESTPSQPQKGKGKKEAAAARKPPSSLLFKQEHQPNRKLLAARGLDMANAHCMEPDVLDQPLPRLQPLDKWKLFAQKRQSLDLLRSIEALEKQSVKLPLPMMLQGNLSKLRLIVVLDLTHDLEAVEEAHDRNVMSVSLVNAHSDLSRITYPVYAGENHLRFQHFFLDWIIKVVNMPPQPEAQNSQ
ncbi:hypothetical protein CEUSTIGMA_g5473.t1 [Chlamydomonas eustigma]|uniref:Uncharacterized protein n=1 Tax=Chlamydomonas eustigma TaxID=1157962 RepID=A0A250X4P1_9CHLO|nr:hypothetical protein CEUSTIGMA_g5473.t1 [Chlamydomonas eustigma]|eukprot:GAX78031.1 hypothetical protein CEUSTIGMA_g5473.t1 [Chlamydomonas eustigma]